MDDKPTMLPDGWTQAKARIIGETQAQRPKFALVRFDAITVDCECAYLIKGLIPRRGLTVLWGPPKCGKSFLAFDMAMHAALGWDYRGRRVQQGTIVYCALEGANGFRARIQAFRINNPECADAPFYLMATPLNLIADHLALIDCIRAELGEDKPVAVFIDTLNRSLVGSESDDRDMAAYIQAADAIRHAFECSAVIIHHCGVDVSRPRGHTSLTGAVDAQIAVKRDNANNIIAAVEWMKDGPEGDSLVSRLAVVEVGVDVDGDPITSCVVEPVEGAAQKAERSGPKLTKGAKIALAAIREALSEVGEIPPASNHIPPNTKAVTLRQWRDYAYRQGISSSDDARARQVAFQRAHETLLAAKAVAVWDPYAWLA